MSLVANDETPELVDPGEAAFYDPTVLSKMGAAFDATPCDARGDGSGAQVCEVFTQEMNRLRMEDRAGIASAKAEIAKIDRELETLLNLILKGGAADAINAKNGAAGTAQEGIGAVSGRG